jgi:hypothetical protein
LIRYRYGYELLNLEPFLKSRALNMLTTSLIFFVLASPSYFCPSAVQVLISIRQEDVA